MTSAERKATHATRIRKAQQELNSSVEHKVSILDQERISQKAERHKHIFTSRRKAFYDIFSIEDQELLEEEMKTWPVYPVGIPLPGIRAKILNLLGLDHRQDKSHEIVRTWLEIVGWSIVGRYSYYDDEGVVWGPSPIEGIDHPFPYSRGFYHKVKDMWILNQDDPLHETFFPNGIV